MTLFHTSLEDMSSHIYKICRFSFIFLHNDMLWLIIRSALASTHTRARETENCQSVQSFSVTFTEIESFSVTFTEFANGDFSIFGNHC